MKVTQHEDSLWRKSDKKTTLLINEELQDHPKDMTEEARRWPSYHHENTEDMQRHSNDYQKDSTFNYLRRPRII